MPYFLFSKFNLRIHDANFTPLIVSPGSTKVSYRRLKPLLFNFLYLCCDWLTVPMTRNPTILMLVLLTSIGCVWTLVTMRGV